MSWRVSRVELALLLVGGCWREVGPSIRRVRASRDWTGVDRVGAVLACFLDKRSGDPAAWVRRMAAVSPYRGEVELWVSGDDAIAVQSMGWDASLAWGGEWVVAVHGYVSDWGTMTAAGASGRLLAERTLGLLAAHGLSFVGHLRGEFALLAFHPPSRRVYMVRDFLGKRPLFYARAKERLVVASEVRQVAAGAELSGQLDPQLAVQWIAGLDVPANTTEYTAIDRVAPATITIFHCEEAARGPEATTYWRSPQEGRVTARATTGDKDQLGRLLRQAVQRALVGVGSVAVGVSSGVDSAALWALLCRQRRADGRSNASDVALSLVFPGLPCDETDGIRALHAWCGTAGCEIDAAGESPLARVSYLIERSDRLSHPMAFTIGVLAEQAAARGVRVLLTGHGPDEFLAGRVTYLLDLFARGHLGAFVRDCLSFELRETSRGRFLARQVVAALRQFKRRPRGARPPWLGQPAWAAMEARRRGEPRLGFRHSAQIRSYVSGYQAGGALDAFEQLAAVAGVEHRSPFLDQDLVDFALALPGRALMAGRRSKWLLRETLAGELPEVLRGGWKVSFNCVMERDCGAAADHLLGAARATPVATALVREGGLDIAGLVAHNPEEDALFVLKALRVLWQTTEGPTGASGLRNRKEEQESGREQTRGQGLSAAAGVQQANR